MIVVHNNMYVLNEFGSRVHSHARRQSVYTHYRDVPHIHETMD